MESVNQHTTLNPLSTQSKDLVEDDGAGATSAIEDTLHHGFCALSQVSDAPNGPLSLGQSYLDFDGGFIGSHQQFLSEGYSHAAEYQRRPSFLDHKWGVDDIDRYMVNDNSQLDPTSYLSIDVCVIHSSILEARLTPYPSLEHARAEYKRYQTSTIFKSVRHASDLKYRRSACI